MVNSMLSFSGSRVLFHVTPAVNTLSILCDGLDPRFSTGKMHAVWLVSKSRIEWSAIHVSLSKHTLPEDLSVCAVPVQGYQVHKFFKVGFYYSFDTLQVESITPLMFVLHSGNVSDYE